MRHLTIRLVIVGILALTTGVSGRAVRGQTPVRKKLLFLTHAALYKHPSLAPAEAAVTEYGHTGGFDVTTREGYKQESAALDLSFLTPEYLAQFDGLMLMTNGNLPLTDPQKRSIVDFVRNGKALVGMHCATLTLYDYPEFGEVLGGYYRRSIIPTSSVGQRMGVLKVEDSSHPATKMMGGSWPVAEEFYQFGAAVWDASKPTEQISQVGRLHIPMAFSRDRVHVLLSLDTQKTDLGGPGPEVVEGGDYPSGPRTRSSARTSPAASAGRLGWKTSQPIFFVFSCLRGYGIVETAETEVQRT